MNTRRSSRFKLLFSALTVMILIIMTFGHGAGIRSVRAETAPDTTDAYVKPIEPAIDIGNLPSFQGFDAGHLGPAEGSASMNEDGTLYLPDDIEAKSYAPKDKELFDKYYRIIKHAAKEYGLPKEIIIGQIKRESDWNNTIISTRGASGLMQLMPSTAKSMGLRSVQMPRDDQSEGSYSSALRTAIEYKHKNGDDIGYYDERFDPGHNIEAGIRYMKWLINNYPEFSIDGKIDMGLVLASYNYGPKNIKKACCSTEGNETVCETYQACSEYMPQRPKQYVQAVLSYAKAAQDDLY